MPAERVGGTAQVAARGLGDGDAPAVAACAIGVEAVRPPSPVHLIAERGADGGLAVRWTRRSRAGWAWVDGIDAPVGEASEAYRVTIGRVTIGPRGAAAARTAEVGAPSFVYDPAMQAADAVAAGSMLTIAVVQIGATAASRPAELTIEL